MRLGVARLQKGLRGGVSFRTAGILSKIVVLFALTSSAAGQSGNSGFTVPDSAQVISGGSSRNRFLLLNGKPDQTPITEKWPFTVRADFLSHGTFCTATMIGPRVLLTAAHCISNLPRGPLPMHLNIYDRTANCRYHPSFRLQGFAFQFDYALCLIDRPIDVIADGVPNALKFERLSLDARDSNFRYGDQASRYFVLVGYGCTTYDQKLSEKRGLSGGYTRVDLFTPLRMRSGVRGSRDNAILCAGDSGGAVYRLADLKNPYGPRTIVAVNSANIVQGGRVGDYSFLARTSAPAFVTFFRQWKRDMGNPKVCGVDRDIDALCRAWR